MREFRAAIDCLDYLERELVAKHRSYIVNVRSLEDRNNSIAATVQIVDSDRVYNDQSSVPTLYLPFDAASGMGSALETFFSSRLSPFFDADTWSDIPYYSLRLRGNPSQNEVLLTDILNFVFDVDSDEYITYELFDEGRISRA